LAVLEIRFLALPSINAVKHFPLAIVDRGSWFIWKTSRRAAKHSGAKSRSSHGSLTGRSVSSSMLRSVVHESAPACRGGRRFDPDYLHQNPFNSFFLSRPTSRFTLLSSYSFASEDQSCLPSESLERFSSSYSS